MTQVKMKPGSSTIFASCSVDCTVKIWDMKLKDDPLVHSLEVSLQFTRVIQNASTVTLCLKMKKYLSLSY